MPSQRFRSSNRFSKLSLHKMALESPSASAVELDMFSTKRCLTFFRIKSNVLPWAGSACSLLYLIETELFVKRNATHYFCYRVSPQDNDVESFVVTKVNNSSFPAAKG